MSHLRAREAKRLNEETRSFLHRRETRARIHAAFRGRPLNGQVHKATSLAYMDAFAQGLMTEEQAYTLRVKILRQTAKQRQARHLALPKWRKA